LDPPGERIWWFDDERGNETGVWRAEPFAGPERQEPVAAAPGVEPGYAAGLALGRGFAIVGTSNDAGSRVWISTPDGAAELRCARREDAGVGGLSRDELLLSLSHSEHGDSRHPALRVLGRDGRTVADLWDGPGLGLTPGPWSPVSGDRRLVVLREGTG